MGHALHDLVRHNTWATAQVLHACRGCDEAMLHATVPGTFGTIVVTLRHYIDSELSYLFRASGLWSELPWQKGAPADLDLLTERAALLATAWERYLAGEVDTEFLGAGSGDDGATFAIRGGVFIAQALHHANEHRAHICTILGAHGHEAPDVSAWGYALATGRSVMTTLPTAD